MLREGRHQTRSDATLVYIENLPEPDAIYAEFGRRLKKERRKQKITQESLAEAIDVSVETIKRVEKGESIRLDIAYRAALALRVPLASLLPTQQRDKQTIQREIEVLWQELKAI